MRGEYPGNHNEERFTNHFCPEVKFSCNQGDELWAWEGKKVHHLVDASKEFISSEVKLSKGRRFFLSFWRNLKNYFSWNNNIILDTISVFALSKYVDFTTSTIPIHGVTFWKQAAPLMSPSGRTFGNNPFHGIASFNMDQIVKSIYTAEKRTSKIVKLPSLRAICWKRTQI